jgi:PiT family inorganic phosphate transporter
LIPESAILAITLAAGLYMAWTIGANDVANSMATAVGARAITLAQAVLIAAVLEFAGASLVGSHVTETVRKGIVSPEVIGAARLLARGSLAAVLAAGLWVTVATWKELPVSTTHSVVGAMLGFGLAAGGIEAVSIPTLVKVVASWVVSPVFGGLLSFLLFQLILRRVILASDPVRSAERAAPYFIGLTIALLVSSILLKTNLGSMLSGRTGIEIGTGRAVLIGCGAGVVAGLVGHLVTQTLAAQGRIGGVEPLFRRLQIITSCYVAFAHGANDVANAIGPVATIWNVYHEGTAGLKVPVPTFLLALGGGGIVLGLATWGYKVMRTIGRKITELNNSRGFSVDFSVATTVLIASKLGMPISTTHTVVGAVVGVGLARGIRAIDLGVLRGIVVSWLLTVPVAAVIAVLLYWLLGFVL